MSYHLFADRVGADRWLFATATLWGVVVFLLGAGLAHVIDSLVWSPGTASDALIGYGYAHPFVQPVNGDALLVASPPGGTRMSRAVFSVAIVSFTCFVGGYLHATIWARNRSHPVLDTVALGIGYSLIALFAASTLELQGSVFIGGGDTLEPLSTTLSTLLTAITVGGLGRLLATRVDWQIAVAILTLSLGALLLSIWQLAPPSG